ncbi:MAG: hypothetical protein A3K61_06780 [Thaumarchaeota archaeon RBG_16_49_8]|nr:MAG: hypothetical protein A3K61_06780 [Thaumarchaeota archaeon RBG_16_49_8]
MSEAKRGETPIITSLRRTLASLFMILGGVSWITFGLSHLFFPSVLKWDTALSSVTSTDIFGITISNRAFIYLFNSDLLLYDILLGVISIMLASYIKKGKRVAANYSIALGVYFIFRAGLQIYYFGASPIDILQAAASIGYAAIYLFPLTALQEFSEE